MQGWEMQFEERGGGAGGGKSTWLKLANDGDASVVAFLGEPYGRDVVFEGNKYVAFNDTHKQQGLTPTARLAVNVGVLATKEVKVFEMGIGTFKDIVALKHKFGLAQWAFEIKRSGKPRDPKTKYTVLPDRQLTAEEKAWLATVPLVDLVKLYEAAPKTRDADAGAPTVTPAVAGDAAKVLGGLAPDEQRRFLARFGIKSLAELPAELADKAMAYLRQAGSAAAEPTLFINDTEVSALSVELKQLPPAQVQEWLKHLGIERVRELPTTRLPAAKEFLALLMKTYGPAAETTPVDPFA